MLFREEFALKKQTRSMINHPLLTFGSIVLIMACTCCSWDPPDANPEIHVAANAIPVADAGDNRAIPITEASAVLIDGTGSSDPDGDDLHYTWLSLDPGVVISDANRHAASFTIDLTAGGEFSFMLVVDDGNASSAPDTVTISVPTPDGWVDDDFALDNPQTAQFRTIQAAVNALGPNTLIVIRPGTYTEHVTLDQGIHLLGLPGSSAELPEIRSSVGTVGDDLSVLHLTSFSIIENLSISCTTSASEDHLASIVNVREDSTGAEIRHCRIQTASGSSNQYVDGVSIQSNGRLLISDGSRIEVISGEGIVAWDNSQLTIEDARIGHTLGTAVYTIGNDSLRVDNTVIHHAGANGLDLDSRTITINHCTVAYFNSGDMVPERAGIQINGTTEPSLTNTLVYSDRDNPAYYGGTISRENVQLNNLPNRDPASNASPLFEDGENGNFTLLQGSPAGGAGEGGTDIGAMGDILLP
jgi:hypothetical protein